MHLQRSQPEQALMNTMLNIIFCKQIDDEGSVDTVLHEKEEK